MLSFLASKYVPLHCYKCISYKMCYGGEGSFLSDSICSVTAVVLTKFGICNAISVKSGVEVFFCTSALPNIYGVILGILSLSDSFVYSVRAT